MPSFPTSLDNPSVLDELLRTEKNLVSLQPFPSNETLKLKYSAVKNVQELNVEFYLRKDVMELEIYKLWGRLYGENWNLGKRIYRGDWETEF